MTLDVKGVVRGGVQGDETLTGLRRVEALHLMLTPSQRLLRGLGPVALAQALLMLGI